MLLMSWVWGCAAPTPPPNVVLVTMDTVRADHLGLYGHTEARTPVLDGLGAEGTVFETAISVAPITMPTHTTMMTGLYPVSHGVRGNGAFVLAQEHRTLAERLGDHGYDTAAVVSAAVLDSKFGLDQGFRVYDDDLSAGGPKKMFMFKELRGDVSVDKAIGLLDDLEEPFFLWLHLFDAHADYDPPPPYDVVFHKQPYDGEIAFVDEQVGRLVSELDRRGLSERTHTVLTADHGDSLGEHGEKTHGIFVYRATTHVPLIVRGPGVRAQRVSGVVSQVDLASTIASLAGLPDQPSDGVSLAPVLRKGEAVPARAGVYAEAANPRMHFGWHEIRAFDSGVTKWIDAPTPELYDLALDPHERTNLHPGISSPVLEGALAKVVGDDDLGQVKLEEMDSQTRNMLVALGYAVSVGGTDGALPDPKDVAHRWVDLQRCQALVRAKAHVPARKCLEKLLADDPDNWTARMSLAGVLRAMGKLQEAMAALEPALENNADHVKTVLSGVGLLGELGRFDDAVALAKGATTKAPSDPETWTVLGDLYLDHDKLDEAMDAYGTALQVDSSFVEAYMGVANVFHRRKRSDKALVYLERAVELDPYRASLWFNLGVVRDGLGRQRDAVEAYEEALALDPGHAMTLNNLGTLRRSQHRDQEAEAYFMRAMDVDPMHVEARFNLGTMVMEDDPERAATLFAEAVLRKNDLYPARHNLARCLHQLGRDSEARKELRWLVANAPSPIPAHVALAEIALDAGDTALARRELGLAVGAGGPQSRRQLARHPKLGPYVPSR